MITNYKQFNELYSLSTLNLNTYMVKGAKKGDLKLVQDSLDNGAEIHYLDDLALFTAAKNDNFDIVKFLISKGATVDKE